MSIEIDEDMPALVRQRHGVDASIANLDRKDYRGVQSRLTPQAIAMVQAFRAELDTDGVSAHDAVTGAAFSLVTVIHNMLISFQDEEGVRDQVKAHILKAIVAGLFAAEDENPEQYEDIDDVLKRFQN